MKRQCFQTTGKNKHQDLKRGITRAILRHEGKIPNEREQLKSSAKHGEMRSATSLRNRAGILSGPTAFLSFRFCISIITSFESVKLMKMDWLTRLRRKCLKLVISLENLSERLDPTVEKYLLNLVAIEIPSLVIQPFSRKISSTFVLDLLFVCVIWLTICHVVLGLPLFWAIRFW
ncbi:uncharacterized protein LOC120337733 [Styela clava]